MRDVHRSSVHMREIRMTIRMCVRMGVRIGRTDSVRHTLQYSYQIQKGVSQWLKRSGLL